MAFNYSTYHTDPWHWGVITGTILDYINNFELFKEIHIFYGPGQIIFLKLINYFYTIDYFSIGIVTSIIYVVNLLLIYFISKNISNKLNAFIVVLIFFALSNYAQAPWPDFYAGLCITISILFLELSKSNKKFAILASFFFILSITFRTTYLYTIMSAILGYLVFIKIFKINLSTHIKYFFIHSFGFLTLYFILLFINGNFVLWLEQGILITSSLIETKKFYDFDVSYIYVIAKFVYHFLLPKKLENFYFLMLFITCLCMFCYFIFKKKINLEILEKNNILFFLFLSISGLIQSIYQTDVFRNLMSSVSIFFIFVYFLNLIDIKKKVAIYLLILFCLIPIMPKNFYESKVNIFPTIGYVNFNDEIINDKKIFNYSSINFFGKHKFNQETLEYYKTMYSIICKFDAIANYSIDRTLGYICDKNSLPSPSISINREFIDSSLEKKFKNSNIEKNEIVISDFKYKNDNLVLLKEITLPRYTRFTKSDLFRQSFDNRIFLYIGKN